MARKDPKAIHPLAIAEALTEINSRAGLLLAEIHNASDLAPGMNADQLRMVLGRIDKAANDLRAVMWPDEA